MIRRSRRVGGNGPGQGIRESRIQDLLPRTQSRESHGLLGVSAELEKSQTLCPGRWQSSHEGYQLRGDMMGAVGQS